MAYKSSAFFQEITLTRLDIAFEKILAANCLFSIGSKDPGDEARHVNSVKDSRVEIA